MPTSDRPLVTIGLPVAKEPISYIRDAIRSVQNQTFRDWELVVVADGAPRGTVEYLKSLEDARIRVVSHHRSAGLAARLNEISTLAEGEYLARFDADDIMLSTRIEHQLRTLQESGADLISGRAVIIGEDNQVFAESPVLSQNVAVASMFKSTPFVHPTVFARTEWFRRHPYDARLLRSQDKALWISAAADSTFRRDAEPVLFYRVSSTLDPAKYARTASFERRIVRRFGPEEIGRLKTAQIIIQSLTKQLAVWLASAIKHPEIITRRRFNGIDEMARRQWTKALRISTAPAETESNQLEEKR